MNIQRKTLEKLRNLINEETEYRKGHEIVAFFNDFDNSRDTYGNGFPSRWIYTDARLEKMNGTATMDTCIKKVFAPVNFVGRFDILDTLISDFNQYLAFDGWMVVRNGKEITFSKPTNTDFGQQPVQELKENEFLKMEFKEVSINSLALDGTISVILENRFEEIKKCFQGKAYLATIFLSGSTLEGVLLGLATQHPRLYNQATSAPKDNTGKVKQFHDWTLSNFIDASHEIGLLKEDVKKFSHALRDFRNYIHPFEQMSSGFQPDEHTAKICLQVLKAAIHQLTPKVRAEAV